MVVGGSPDLRDAVEDVELLILPEIAIISYNGLIALQVDDQVRK